MKKILYLIKLVFVISVFWVNYANATDKIFEKAKKAIVTIDSRVTNSAYKDTGRWTGTGFVTDKERGLIVTNAHIVGKASVGSYMVTFYNGKQADAKLVYYDIWQDYAILKVSTEELPNSIEQIEFSKEPPKLNQNVFVIGNSESRGFSFHTGNLSDLYSIEGEMPQCSYIINLNIAGGSSGSPILNEKNEALGVLYAGSKTYVLALHGKYVQKTLETIKAGKMPIRKHIGIITDLYSLDDAVKYRNFPKQEMEEYVTKFPNSRNKVINIQTIIAGSPAEKFLKAGDIIWQVNDTLIGSNLSILDLAMDSADENTIKLAIYRNGEKIEKIIPLYNVNSNKVQRLVKFAGATFFEADDYISSLSGIPLKALSVVKVQSGSAFRAIPTYYDEDSNNLHRIHVHSVGKYKINNLDDLIKYLPEIVKQKFFTVNFKNYQPYFTSYNGNLSSSHDDMIIDIVFDSIDSMPRILTYDAIENGWISYALGSIEEEGGKD